MYSYGILRREFKSRTIYIRLSSFFFSPLVLRIETGALHMLAKCFTTEVMSLGLFVQSDIDVPYSTGAVW